MNILIRADSSSKIGTGHIMRDLVLAKQFPNDNIIFATQKLDGNINHKIIEAGYQITLLKSNKIDDLIDMIFNHKIEFLIIDHYNITYDDEKYIQEKTGIKIFVLDDTYQKHHCDILLNHNIYADKKRYKNLVPKDCELRCGANFTLLRDEFKEEKKKKDIVKNSIFVGMGGADTTNSTKEILSTILMYSNLKINVVTTTANPNLQSLQEFIQKYPQITLHINSANIASLMNQAKLAIVTPSVVLNELFYLEIPFIAIQTADNQREMMNYLLGQKKRILSKFNKQMFIKYLIEDINLINFTDLNKIQVKMILEWRNHPNIRKWMYTQNEITLAEHLQFIENLKSNNGKMYFLVQLNSENIGVIDFYNFSKDSCEFGLYANPSQRGIGHILLQSLIQKAFFDFNLKKLFGEVFEENSKALKLYKKFYFQEKNIKVVNTKKVICMELINENREF